MPTTRHTLCGLAALCLLCVLPRLGALTITQSHFAAIDQATMTGGFNVAPYWFFAPFDPAQGVLERVTFQATVTALVRGSDVNQYPPWPPSPATFTPYVHVGLTVDVSDFNAGYAWNSDISIGPAVMVPAYGTFGHSATLSTTVDLVSTAPDDLARFSNLGTWQEGDIPHFAYIGAAFNGTSFWGGMSSKGNITATLTYEYRVPDGGAPLAMLLASLGTLGAFRLCCRRHGITSV